MIIHVNGIVKAIREKIVSVKAAYNIYYRSIRINEPADLRIVVTGHEVVEPGLGIKVIAAVADGVDAGHGAAGAEQLAPGVVAVVRNYRPAGGEDLHHVALQVRHIVVEYRRGARRGLVRERIRHAALVVEEFQLLSAPVLRYQLVPLPHITVLHTAHSLRLPQPVHIVGVTRDYATGRSGYCAQTPAVDPGEVVPVVPVRGIAYLVIRDRLPAVRRQQIFPVAVAVGVGVGVHPVADRTDVAVGVVGVGVGDAVHRLRQHLPVAVIGVACRSGAADGRDVAYVVIGVGIAVERGIALLIGQAAHQHRRAVGPGTRHISIAFCQEAIAVQAQAAGSKTLEPVIGVGVLTVGRQSHRTQTAVRAVVGVAVDPVVPEYAVPRGAHLVTRLRHAVGAVVVGKIDLYAVSTVPLRH